MSSKQTRLSPEAIRLHDKKRAAIHETGHATVALAVGVPFVQLTLGPTLTEDLGSESAYTGQTALIRQSGKLKSATIGFAGALAEMIHDEFEADENDALEYFDLEILLPSPTDLALVERLHPKWRPRAIRLAVQILKEHWTTVRGLAFELYSNHRGFMTATSPVLSQKEWRGLL